MTNSLITVRPKIKQKGFNPDNIGISAFTKEDTAVYNRILRMTNTPYFKDLSDNHSKLVSKISMLIKINWKVNQYLKMNMFYQVMN